MRSERPVSGRSAGPFAIHWSAVHHCVEDTEAKCAWHTIQLSIEQNLGSDLHVSGTIAAVRLGWLFNVTFS